MGIKSSPLPFLSTFAMSDLRIDGRFFSRGGERVTLRGVTLGPLPPEQDMLPELRRIAELGANMVRLYEPPTLPLLDLAAELGVMVLCSVPWDWASDFLVHPGEIARVAEAHLSALAPYAAHPALVGVYVANEIPVDLVRWMGVSQVQAALEELISTLRQAHPALLYAYANFPTTEYLELKNADFTAFNLYLEQEQDLEAYLQHLHVVAGARPLVISEIGADAGTLSPHGEPGQARILEMTHRVAQRQVVAGLTWFAWSDRWWKGCAEGGALVDGWQFGLQRADGTLRPIAQRLLRRAAASHVCELRFSVIVCTYNGGERLARCLAALLALRDPTYEVIVVDDGSTDQTVAVATSFADQFLRAGVPYQRISQPNLGLSAARNTGAIHAQGAVLAYTDDDARPDPDWLTQLRATYTSPSVGMSGGYGLTPPDLRASQAEIAQLPGQACPVLLSSTTAEHLPGCNMSVRRSVWEEVGGFCPRYRVAGDDVDFCWRVMDAGYELRFTPHAYVWHEPRLTYRAYLRQQWGYGKAEALLATDHPARTGHSGLQWLGQVYNGATTHYSPGCTIYSGLAGLEPFQPLSRPTARTGTHCRRGWSARGSLLTQLHPVLRALSRWRHGWQPSLPLCIALIQVALLQPLRSCLSLPAHSRWRRLLRGRPYRYWTADAITRDQLLQHLSTQGWHLVDHPQWDAHCTRPSLRARRVQLALEHHENGGRIVLLRTNALAEVEHILQEHATLHRL